MGVEIEVKVLEIQVPAMILKIESAGGEFEGEWLQTTSLFDFPDLRLLKEGGYVRVRNEGTAWRLTRKRRSSPEAVDELEVRVDDPGTAGDILLSLGLEKVLYFEKKRRQYRRGNTVFDIDELPTLPAYLEIEAPSRHEIDAALSLLAIPPERALFIGPEEFLAHYGLNLKQLRELRFR